MTQDRQLKNDVLAELAWEPSIDQADIGVTARDGVVTLAGFVGSFLQKYSAEKAAERVRGVKSVVDDLEVHLFEHSERTDEDIRTVACKRLRWDASVPMNAIHVAVDGGRIALTGQVDWNFQREAAEKAVRSIIGVVAVDNAVQMNPTVDADNIRVDIMNALHRSGFNLDQIGVATHGGQITLTGTVHSQRDFAMASATAWSARGAKGVENDQPPLSGPVGKLVQGWSLHQR